ncbi:MAG: hypothetical protein K0S39_6103, partial [Paenibacillus sp.]|nr:hypothetical protein [Paenibacillus sp.]
MNMMFLNSLERTAGENEVSHAQVSISESQGRWLVAWQETETGGEMLQEVWYEGTGLEEMLTAFRTHIFTKQCEGFKPLLDV